MNLGVIIHRQTLSSILADRVRARLLQRALGLVVQNQNSIATTGNSLCNDAHCNRSIRDRRCTVGGIVDIDIASYYSTLVQAPIQIHHKYSDRLNSGMKGRSQ